MLWNILTGLDLRAGLRRAGGSSSAWPAGAHVGDVISGEGGRRRMVSTDDMDEVNRVLLRSGSVAALAMVSAAGERYRREARATGGAAERPALLAPSAANV